jgi:malonyl-ACP O-methyltransferase BioC
MIEKKRIARSFQKAAESYERQAVIQHFVADHLLELLDIHSRRSFQRVLEIGCCTGLLTRKLLKRHPEIYEILLNDLVESFAEQAGNLPGVPAVGFLAGDIENLPLAGQFDLIISSSTLHWVHNLDMLLGRLARHLAPGGILAVSLYGPENMQEIRELSGIGLHYDSRDEVEAKIKKHFSLVHSEEQIKTFTFASPEKVLEHLRETGVNALQQSPWTPRKLRHFVQSYQDKFSNQQGVVLRYHPLFLLAHSLSHPQND